MNITEALSKIAPDKAEYFKYKFPDTRYDQSRPQRTEEEFLKLVERKTIHAYKRWEKTDEYKALVALYLQSKTANDLHEIYQVVSDKAKTGDEKSVKLFLQLSKEVTEHSKQALKELSKSKSNDTEDDGLVI